MSDWTLPLLRTAQSDDKDAVRRFLASMDRDGLYRRHFSVGDAPNIALLKRMDMLDKRNRLALLAVDRDGGVLAHGEYVADKGIAEFALMVLPLFRLRGIGTCLLRELMDVALNAGQRKMIGVVQATNARALRLVLSNGFQAVSGEDRTSVIVSVALGGDYASMPHQTNAGRAKARQGPENQSALQASNAIRVSTDGGHYAQGKLSLRSGEI